MNFGSAIELAKQGKLISRSGWNGKAMFVFMRKASNEKKVTDLLGMDTIPKGVKDFFELKNQPITESKNPVVVFTPYLCMKAADDTIVNGWLASQTDMLSDDWDEVDGTKAFYLSL